MKEHNKNQQPDFALPPQWCSAICRNAMNEICVEHCAITKDMSGFDPKPDVSLLDLSRFPLNDVDDMTKEEKFKVVAIYLSKIVDYLQGNKNEDTTITFRRPHIDRSRSSTLSETLQIEGLLPRHNGSNSSLEIGTECKNQELRPSEVAESTD